MSRDQFNKAWKIGILVCLLVILAYPRGPHLLVTFVVGAVDVVFIGGIIVLIVMWFWPESKEARARRYEREERERQEREERLRLEKLKPRSITFEEVFSAHTPANFAVQYRLRFQVEAPNEEEFIKAKLGEQDARAALALDYNQSIFQSLLQEESYRFHLGWNKGEALVNPHSQEAFFARADRFVTDDGKSLFRKVPSSKLQAKLKQRDLEKPPCRVSVSEIVQNILTNELIERNYAMLTDEQKKCVENDEEYRAFDEVLAVAALRRRLDYDKMRDTQNYDAGWVSIHTERAGREFKIRWRFNAKRPQGYDLLGFRKTGGFALDHFDEEKNGTLRIQTRTDGETTETLDEGETYFYTFIYRPPEHTSTSRYAALRFQVTITTEEERAAIEATVRRIEKKAERSKPIVYENPALDKAVNALLDFAKFEVGYSATVNAIKTAFEQSNFSAGEKQEKIGRLIDAANVIRESSEPRLE